MRVPHPSASTIIGVALALGAAVACGCTKPPAPEAADEESAPLTVDCEAARAEAGHDRADLRGVVGVAPEFQATVAAAVSGRVKTLSVRAGQHVAAGAEIATIDAPEARATAGEGDAGHGAAAAELAGANAALARAQRLVERGIAPQRDLDDATARRATAVASLAAANARQQLGNRQRSAGRVVAPISGVVLTVSRRVGELVDGTANTPLVEIADTSHLEVRADVPAAVLVKLGAATHATVSIDALPGQSFPGDIVYLSPAVDPVTGLGQIRATVTTAATPGVHLVLGLAGTLSVPFGDGAPSASVAAVAIRRASDGTEEVVVCHREGDKLTAAVRPVTTAARGGGRVTLATGLAVGERVAITRVLAIRDGDALIERRPGT